MPTQLPGGASHSPSSKPSATSRRSRDLPLGWTLGLAVQPLGAAYRILTSQPAFLATSTIITIGNLLALGRHAESLFSPRPPEATSHGAR